MARINIEEVWWSDARRLKLIRLFKGDARLADGLMVQAWRLAQEFADQGFMIPFTQFTCLDDCSFLFDCFLAEVLIKNHSEPPLQIQALPKQCLEELGKGSPSTQTYLVYVKGSEKHMEWLTQKRTSGSLGGRKSAQRPRDSRGRLLPKVQAEPKHVQPSLSLSSSSSSSLSLSGSPSKKTNVGIRLDYPPKFDQAWELYGRRGDKREAFREYETLKLTEEEGTNLTKAITHYVEATPDTQYRKHFCRFLKGDWREWISANVLLPLSGQPKANGAHPGVNGRARRPTVNEHNLRVVQEYMRKNGGDPNEN